MLSPGDQIGPYTLIECLGQGGFGTVWLSKKSTPLATTRVALKMPRDDDIDLETIKKEANIWVKASGHPNVLPIIDADVYDGQVVIASEYAPNGSLRRYLQKHGGKAPTVEIAVEIILGILAGLEHLHSRNPVIIHRDLKPDNILFQGFTPRLADFGVSRILESTRQSSTAWAGTPLYMAPEAFKGTRDEQTDVWSVGAIFYELLTGSLPSDSAPLPSSIPKPLKKVISRALREERVSRRYRSAAEMRTAIAKATRPPKTTLVGIILLVAVLAFAGGGMLFQQALSGSSVSPDWCGIFGASKTGLAESLSVSTVVPDWCDQFNGTGIDETRWRMASDPNFIGVRDGALNFVAEQPQEDTGGSLIAKDEDREIAEVSFTTNLESYQGNETGAAGVGFNLENGRDIAFKVGIGPDGEPGGVFWACKTSECGTIGSGDYEYYEEALPYPRINWKDGEPIDIRVAQTDEGIKFYIDDEPREFILDGKRFEENSPIVGFGFTGYADDGREYHLTIDDVCVKYADS